MSLTRKTFKHAAIYSMATVIGKLAGFLMLPFYAHIFQTKGFGIIALMDTGLGLLGVLLAGGFQTAILRIYHEQHDSHKKIVLGTGIRLVWGLSVLIVLLPFVFCIPLSHFIFGSGEYYPLILLALLTLVIDVAGQSASTILIIKQQSLVFSSISLLRLIVGISLNIWLVIILGVGLIGVFISSLGTALICSLAFHIIAFRGHGFGFNRQIAVQLLRFQLPLLPGEIIAFLGRQAERVLVRMLIGLEGVGILEMAYRFPPLLTLFITIPFQRAWRTKSMEIAEEQDAPSTMSYMFSRYLFLMVFLGLIIAVTIQSILELLTPAVFWQATSIVQIEIITTILAGCVTYLSFGILYKKKTSILSLIRSLLTPAKVLLGYLFISAWGLLGAAYSALIIEIITLVWIFIKAQGLYAIPLEYWKIVIIGVGASVLFLLLNAINYSDLGPAVYFREHLFFSLATFLQGTSVGEWKSGKLVLLFQDKQHQLMSLFFKAILSLSFLTLMPFVWWQRSEPIVEGSTGEMDSTNIG